MRPAILQVAYPLAPVGPDAMGGAEQVLSMLDEALVAAGMRSIVIAAEGSTVLGDHVPVPVPDLLDEEAVSGAHAVLRATIARVLTEERVDLVHFHGVDFHAYLPAPGVPALVTLHLPPSFYSPAAFASGRPDTWLHCVSASQRRGCPDGLRLLDDIPNGVRLDRFAPAPTKGDYALGLGRICAEKGWHLALDAARRAGRPMVLAGQVYSYPGHVAWFEAEIRPRLDDARRFVGVVASAEKDALLAGARCVVVPSLVAETSSLVAMEALASGTPVVGFRSGALPDVITHGRTGFLVDDVAGMARAIEAAGDLDPADCRREAEERWSAAACTRRYIALYAGLTRSRAPSGPRSDVVAGVAALEALAEEWAGLWERCPTARPFQHPAWAVPWARAFGGAAAGAVIQRDGGRLVGVLPWWRSAPAELSLLGAGITDDLDALLAPGVAVEPLLAAALEGAERAVLDDLPHTSALRRAEPPPGWRSALEAATPSPVADLRSVGRADALLGARARAALAYARRRAERNGVVSWHDHQSSDRAEILEAWLRLHGAQWEARGQPGVLADTSVRAFHHDAAARLSAAGLLRLHALRVGTTIAGVLYALAGHGETCFYLAAHDPNHAPLSLGHQLVARAIDCAISEGHQRFDFLRGREPYKYAWGAADRPKWRRALAIVPA